MDITRLIKEAAQRAIDEDILLDALTEELSDRIDYTDLAQTILGQYDIEDLADLIQDLPF